MDYKKYIINALVILISVLIGMSLNHLYTDHNTFHSLLNALSQSQKQGQTK